MTNIFSIMVIPKDNVFDSTLNHKKMTYNCTYLDTNKPPHTQPDGLYIYIYIGFLWMSLFLVDIYFVHLEKYYLNNL